MFENDAEAIQESLTGNHLLFYRRFKYQKQSMMGNTEHKAEVCVMKHFSMSAQITGINDHLNVARLNGVRIRQFI